MRYGKREVSLEDEKSQVRVAVEAMLEEAKKVADGNAEYATYEEVFGVEEKERIYSGRSENGGIF